MQLKFLVLHPVLYVYQQIYFTLIFNHFQNFKSGTSELEEIKVI